MNVSGFLKKKREISHFESSDVLLLPVYRAAEAALLLPLRAMSFLEVHRNTLVQQWLHNRAEEMAGESQRDEGMHVGDGTIGAPSAVDGVS